MNRSHLENKKFGYLTVLNYAGKGKWVCKCKCGNYSTVDTRCLNSGHTRSCGCYQRERARGKIWKGFRKHPLADVWSGMINRCQNPKHISFRLYGDRGIKICDRWQDVSKFIEDMYPSWTKGLTLDRIDNDGNYEKSNCRWATRAQQQHNSRGKKTKNSYSIYKGVTWHKGGKVWQASIQEKYIGKFDSEEEAAIAYDKMAIELYGEYAKLNFDTP